MAFPTRRCHLGTCVIDHALQRWGCTCPFRPDTAGGMPGWPKPEPQAVIALGLSDQTLPRYPTAYPPSLPTKLVHPLRIIARISRQLLRTHLGRRFGQQRASRAFVITRPPAYLHTALCAPAQARGHADCELPFRHCTATGESAHGTGTSCHTPSAAKPGHRPCVVDLGESGRRQCWE